jgi:phosphatidylserine/phosphatidylglycerophosphate/cardiolipin synthase-like enzyme
MLRAGDTCWRVEAAGRLRFLVDYQDFFAALAEALAKAERQVLLLGWTFDPRTRLRPDGGRGDAPDQIGRLLIELADRRPKIDIRLLIWRSALAISATQGFLPHRAKAMFKGTGVDFRLDDLTPLGACHHQKVIVIDDALAFCGSGDIALDRWDTPAHPDRDSRRKAPNGRLHPPRHEVMVMADGPVAAAFGDLARERWRRNGVEIAASPASAGDAWPESFAPDVAPARVGIARTEPAWRDRPAVYEVASLTMEAIAAAKRSIYIENQYFTSPLVAEALAARLAEPDGPQVVLVSTHKSPSWFDQLTMDHTRSVFVWRLRAADVFHRLRVLAPFTVEGRPIIVHAKTMVVDDTLARISSANLNNRSDGFDTECELAVEAEDDEARAGIQTLADALLGHWLGRPAPDVARARERFGGMVGAVDDLNRHGRLRPIEPETLGPIAEFVAAFHIGDPIGVGDSWRPWRRRDRIYDLVRALRVANSVSMSKSTTSGK